MMPGTDADQAASDRDQSAADADQGAADADQTAADRDRLSSEADQESSDADQQSADREVAAAADPAPGQIEAHDRERATRAETSLDRQATAHLRGVVSGERDTQAKTRLETAAARDLQAEERDRAAERRDREIAAVLEREGAQMFGHGSDAEDRSPKTIFETATAARAQAAGDRRRAAEDRQRAAEDREEAAHDREVLRLELERAQLDPLTGAYGRATGEIVLRHELERARRSDGVLLLAYADVVGLKALNDTLGHAAGDELLRNAVLAMRSKLRPYDPLVRWGGDEFVCALAHETAAGGARRLSEIQDCLRETHPTASITIGVAMLEDGDSLETLMARADAALLEARGLDPEVRG